MATVLSASPGTVCVAQLLGLFVVSAGTGAELPSAALDPSRVVSSKL